MIGYQRGPVNLVNTHKLNAIAIGFHPAAQRAACCMEIAELPDHGLDTSTLPMGSVSWKIWADSEGRAAPAAQQQSKRQFQSGST